MAASIKVSELQSVSLSDLTTDDFLLVTDVSTSTSKKATFGILNNALKMSETSDYAAEQNNDLQAGLAFGQLYVQHLTVGG